MGCSYAEAVRVVTPFVVAAALGLAACGASDGRAEPPPMTREIVDQSGSNAPGASTDELLTPAGSSKEAGEDIPTSSLPVADPFEYTIDFEEVRDGVDGGWLTVPVDYSDPQAGDLELWVTRHRATSDDRIGILLSNNGGPGVAASTVALNAGAYFGDPLLDSFDVVSWDPRGTGRSGGSVDCIDDEEFDRYFGSSDITPDDDSERQALVDLAREFVDGCVESAGDLLPHIGTNNSARDMDAIRQALGEVQASYLGFSYGSELGAVWATLFPRTVRAAVLDGASHPDSDGIEPARQQQLGFAGVFNAFLARCSDDSSCAFHNDGDAEGAYDRLLADLDEDPVFGREGRPRVGVEIATGGVIQAMYDESSWPALENALAAASEGDGSGLLDLFDQYNRRDPSDGSYPDLIESFTAITCADDPERLTVDQADERATEFAGIAPRVFPSTVGAYTCGFFPPSADPRADITGEGAGPIVVIGATGDPSTPLASSAAMADALEEGVLVTVDANRHTSYGTGDCIDDIVHDSLIWLEPPAAGTGCP